MSIQFTPIGFFHSGQTEKYMAARQSPLNPEGEGRIVKIGESEYCIALKTWRVSYLLNETQVWILQITSGYDQETLLGKKTSRWNDVPLHLEFIASFSND